MKISKVKVVTVQYNGLVLLSFLMFFDECVRCISLPQMIKVDLVLTTCRQFNTQHFFTYYMTNIHV